MWEKLKNCPFKWQIFVLLSWYKLKFSQPHSQIVWHICIFYLLNNYFLLSNIRTTPANLESLGLMEWKVGLSKKILETILFCKLSCPAMASTFYNKTVSPQDFDWYFGIDQHTSGEEHFCIGTFSLLSVQNTWMTDKCMCSSWRNTYFVSVKKLH